MGERRTRGFRVANSPRFKPRGHEILGSKRFEVLPSLGRSSDVASRTPMSDSQEPRDRRPRILHSRTAAANSRRPAIAIGREDRVCRSCPIPWCNAPNSTALSGHGWTVVGLPGECHVSLEPTSRITSYFGSPSLLRSIPSSFVREIWSARGRRATGAAMRSSIPILSARSAGRLRRSGGWRRGRR
jgi:hypothetical protein